MKKVCSLLFALSFLGTIDLVVADVTNGDFETGDFTGWVETGNVNIASDTAYQANGGIGSWPTGTYVAAFNGGDSIPNAMLSQTAPTIADQQFVLEFQFGAFSPLSAVSQTIEVEVRDESSNVLLASLTVADDTPSNNLSGLLENRSLEFTATGNSIMISFVDLSADTNGVDGLLDNVSVVAHAIFADGFESGNTSAWSGIVP